MMRCTEIQFTHKACGPATLTGHDGPSPLLVPVFWTSLTVFSLVSPFSSVWQHWCRYSVRYCYLLLLLHVPFFSGTLHIRTRTHSAHCCTLHSARTGAILAQVLGLSGPGETVPVLSVLSAPPSPYDACHVKIYLEVDPRLVLKSTEYYGLPTAAASRLAQACRSLFPFKPTAWPGPLPIPLPPISSAPVGLH